MGEGVNVHDEIVLMKWDLRGKSLRKMSCICFMRWVLRLGLIWRSNVMCSENFVERCVEVFVDALSQEFKPEAEACYRPIADRKKGNTCEVLTGVFRYQQPQRRGLITSNVMIRISRLHCVITGAVVTHES